MGKCQSCILRRLNDVSEFKDMVREDIRDIFLDLDMFGEKHKLNGKEMLVIVDGNELIEREKRVRNADMGLHDQQFLIYVAAEDFGKRLVPGKDLKFDGKVYEITDVVDEQGIYSISLEAPAK